MEFSTKLTNSITYGFDDSMPQLQVCKLPELKDSEIDELLENPSDSSLERGKISSNFISTCLVKEIVMTQFFTKIRDRFNNKTLTSVQIEAANKIFRIIMPCLSKKYCSAVLTTLIKSSIGVTQQVANDSHGICQFISYFASLAPHLSDIIYEFFGTMILNSSTQSKILKVLKNVVNSIGLCNSGDLIKDKVLTLLNSDAIPAVLKLLYEFIPDELCTRIKFTNDDLLRLINPDRNSYERITMIKKVVSMSDQLDESFAEAVFQSDIFDPELLCYIIDKVNNSDVAEKAFHIMLNSPEPLTKYDLSGIRINKRLKKYVKTDDPSVLIQLSDFVFAAPQLGLMSSFILRAIDLATKDENLLSTLQHFTDYVNRLDSVKPLVTLMGAYKNLGPEPTNISKEYLNLLECWVEATPDIPLDDLFSSIMSLDFSYLPDEFPSFINTLISKNENAKLAINLLLKILDASVSPRHATWFVSCLFDVFHNDNEYIENIVRVLISQMKTDKARNAFFTIMAASRREADFYRIGDEFNFVQDIVINNNHHSIIHCSLHPFHTTSRIYAEVAHKNHKKIDSFILKTDDIQEKTVHFNSSLSIINCNSLQPISLKICELDDDSLNKHAEFLKPRFLTAFARHLPIFWPLLIDSSFKEAVFEWITLFSLGKSLKIYSPLQQILFNDCKNPFDQISSRRVFPRAFLVTVKNTPDIFNNENIEMVINSLISTRFDRVGIAQCCSALLKLDQKFLLSIHTIRKSLIECSSLMIRETVSKIISPETDIDLMISLIPLTKAKNNRSRSKEFFECMKNFKIPPEVFIPFYEDLDQFEFSHYSDADETFISLLELIPVTDSTVNLTIDRLFSPPTCKNMSKPFIHTIESWNAAYKFLSTPLSYPKLKSLLPSLRVPSTTTTLSPDFTYKGRNGIHNLGSTCYINALLQILNAIEPISVGLLTADASHFSNFTSELRTILAQLRFVRGMNLSISQLAESINGFEVHVQQDAMEFFQESIIIRLSNDNEKLLEPLRGKTLSSYYTSEGPITQKEEDFFILSLPTDNLSRLDVAFEKYFEDEPVDGGYSVEGSSDKVQLFHHKSIIQWPDVLAIHLQRFEFTIGMQNKLVHNFGFPVELNPNDLNSSEGTVHCNFKYSLTGVVVHQGTAEQGHYYAIVEGEDKEWYLCNDSNIEYFDIKELTNFAFGFSESALDEDISTGYLLFYKREDLQNVPIEIPADLEDSLNATNLEMWPEIIFRSPNFLNFIHDSAINDKITPDLVDIALHLLFKVAPCDEEIFSDWCTFFKKYILSKSTNSNKFFVFIEEQLGTTVMSLFNLSDKIVDLFSQLFKDALSYSHNKVNSIRIIMKYLDNKCQKRPILCLVFDLIETVCNNTKIDWAANVETLQEIFTYLTAPISKDLMRIIGNQLSNVFNTLMGVYVQLMVEDDNNPNRAILDLFDVNNLNKVIVSARKSDNFHYLLKLVHTHKPDAIINLGEASQFTRTLLSQYFKFPKASSTTRKADENSEKQETFIPKFSITNFGALMFSNDDRLRFKYTEKLKDLIGGNNEVAQYLNNKILNDSYQMPPYVEEATFPVVVLGFSQRFLQLLENGQENLCLEYVDLLLNTSRVAPITVGMQYQFIFDALKFAQNKTIIKNLLEIIRNVIAATSSIAESINDENLSLIMSSNVYSHPAVELLLVFGEKSNNSQLLAACTHFYLYNSIDKHGKILVDLLNKGFRPPRFEIKEKSTQASQLLIANCLCKCWEGDKSDLKEYITSAIQNAVPSKLYMLSEPFVEAVENAKSL